MTPISVILIVQDEARHIRRCIQSVQWADEVIVIDSGSQDDTVNIACSLAQTLFIIPGKVLSNNDGLL